LQLCRDPEILSLHLQIKKHGTSVYTGYDPTAPSLHIGHLLSIMTLIHFHNYSHLRPIALMGGATGTIGDPSGKSEKSVRKMLDTETVKDNAEMIGQQVERVFANGVRIWKVKNSVNVDSRIASTEEKVDKKEGLLVLNNADWYKDLTLLDFLNTIGRLSRVSSMLCRDRFYFFLIDCETVYIQFIQKF
jgi:tyrosyl-tRNA synthetase